MVTGPDFARAPRVDEFEAVDQLLLAAFGGSEEIQLVHRLRQTGAIVQELILPWRDPARNNRSTIGAYAAISRMVAPENWFCLAPVAVKPEWQNGMLAFNHPTRNSYRFGTRLVRMVADPFLYHDLARAMLSRAGLLEGDEPPTLVVLGKPSFYARCGFSQARAAKLISPYPITHTLIARPGDDVPQETLIYPKAFDGV